jgi:hypothetical protein
MPEQQKAIGYAEWRARAVAAIGGPNLLLERNLRRMYILGRTVEEAAEEGQAEHHNSRMRSLRRRRR